MSHNDSSQVGDCLYQEDNSKTGETSHKHTCGTCGATNQPSQNQSMGEGHSSFLNAHTSGGRTSDVHPLSAFNKLQACSMDRMSSIKDHTILIDRAPAGHQTSHKSRWDVTCRALQSLTKGRFSIRDVQTSIMAYNSDYKNRWTFEVLEFYAKRLGHMDNNLETVIPKMAKLALDLPALIKKGIPLLRRQHTKAITLSQQQISCLLANAFFCTFPHRNNTKPGSEYATFPTINFSSLFGNHPKDASKEAQKAQKLRAIIQYFNAVTNEDRHQPADAKPDGLVTFERISLKPDQLPKWNNDRHPLRNLHVSSEGSIEKEGSGLLQVDFACKFIGGGVLGMGSVQEEILFLMSPELIVSRLFTEKLDPNECLRITGSQIYSIYSGYSRTFEWAGPYTDTTKRDQWKRRYRQIVAIDALDFKNPQEQYKKENIIRELNKAYVGFKGDPSTQLPAIATGNWGCGAFGGDPKLKALIQLMAAAVAERDMAYFTFGNNALAKELQNMYDHLKKNHVTVDQLYKTLVDYSDRARERIDLYGFIFKKTGRKPSLL